MLKHAERQGDGYSVQRLQVDFPEDHACSSVRPHVPFPTWDLPSPWPTLSVANIVFSYDPLLTDVRLTEHASNKHSKTLVECFPGYEVA